MTHPIVSEALDQIADADDSKEVTRIQWAAVDALLVSEGGEPVAEECRQIIAAARGRRIEIDLGGAQ